MGLPCSTSKLDVHLKSHFLGLLQSKINELKLPGLSMICDFSPSLHLSEVLASQVISKFRMGVAGLGNKIPRKGYNQVSVCKLCNSGPNNELHIVTYCPALQEVRKTTGLLVYINSSLLAGNTYEVTFANFLEGFSAIGDEKVTQHILIQRGKILRILLDVYLSQW